MLAFCQVNVLNEYDNDDNDMLSVLKEKVTNQSQC